MKKELQPEISIGLFGHVDHGKTTLLEKLSGKWADTHSEEIKRGITIRLGYADATFYKCDKDGYTIKNKCLKCKKVCKELRKVSFIDAPGHETLMATMLSGAAIIDAAILMVASNEECPQPQTKEHLMALEILGIKKIIIVQNKIDLVNEEEALENYKAIKNFIKGTIAEKAPIIPISAQQGNNIDVLIETIEKEFTTPKRDKDKDPIMFIARSFDINRPGTKIDNLIGGVLGGALKQGILKLDDEIEIRPGLQKGNKWESIKTKIIGLNIGGSIVKEVSPGGSFGLATTLDPSIVKGDNLTGNIIGLVGKLPEVWYTMELKPYLLERVVGSKEDLKVDNIKKNENLMLNINSAATVGIVEDVRKDNIKVSLKRPVCADKKDRVTISRLLGSRFRLIGWAEIR